MLHISDEQRRARLAQRHCLQTAAKASSALEVAESLLALHATDPASVYLSVAARSRGVGREQVADAIYGERSLVRLLAMRRTMFVLPVTLAPIAFAACTTIIAKRQRTLLIKHLDGVVPGDRGAWLKKLERATLAALSKEDDVSGQALAKRVPGLRTELDLLPDKAYARAGRITSRVLNLMSADGSIVRGQPSGGIGSSRYGWSRMDRWLGKHGLATMDATEARVQLVRHWLRRFGPGTLLDVQWWTGLNKTQVRAALKACAAHEVRLDGDRCGYLLPDDLLQKTPSKAAAKSWAALLPALDPTPMGWKERDWYLGEHEAALFDRTGNIGPSVWWNGRIVGGWAQRKNGEIALELLETVKPTARKAIDKCVRATRRWLGEERITPRFRTPLERKLSCEQN